MADTFGLFPLFPFVFLFWLWWLSLVRRVFIVVVALSLCWWESLWRPWLYKIFNRWLSFTFCFGLVHAQSKRLWGERSTFVRVTHVNVSLLTVTRSSDGGVVFYSWCHRGGSTTCKVFCWLDVSLSGGLRNSVLMMSIWTCVVFFFIFYFLMCDLLVILSMLVWCTFSMIS